MPSATPLPRGPSVVFLGHPDELMARPGCPVCPHAAEAGDRYLAWFAIEGHSDPVMVTRLSASLGMCPRHTRQIMVQPGAPSRLTAVYRYVLQEARRQLAARRVRLDRCPACEHDESVAERLTGLVLDGLRNPEFRARYQQTGSLCLPHLRVAAGQGSRDELSWLTSRAAAPGPVGPAAAGLPAGGPDPDADARAALRARLPCARQAPAGVCRACLAAAWAERDQLRGVADGEPGHVPAEALLCAAHLADATLGLGDAAPLLSRQAGSLAGAPARRRLTARRRWSARAPAAECVVCRSRAEAASRELRLSWTGSRPAASGLGPAWQPCVRHVLELRELRAADAGLARLAAGNAAQRAEVLLRELTEAARKGTWEHRHDPRGAEMTAWRRAPVLLDGGVTGGSR